jgi:hypothetical protein
VLNWITQATALTVDVIMADGSKQCISDELFKANEDLFVALGDGSWVATAAFEEKVGVPAPSASASFGKEAPQTPPAFTFSGGSTSLKCSSSPKSPSSWLSKDKLKALSAKKKTTGAASRKQWSDIKKSEVIMDLDLLRGGTPASRGGKDLYIYVAEKHHVPEGNIGGWYREKDKIHKSAGHV